MYSSLVSDDLVPIDVRVDDLMIHVRFNGGLQIATPVDRFPRLANAQPAKRERWRKIGRGDGIHWPDVDEDISVRTLLSQPKRKPVNRIDEVPALIGDLLKTTNRLNELFKGRPFTPDGHLVGSIGEVVAEYIYALTLEPCSTPHIDARTADGRSVQIKLTGEKGTRFGVRWSRSITKSPADYLLCLKLTPKGFVEIYNGPFPLELLKKRKDTTNGQVSLTVRELAEKNPGVLPKQNSFDDINRWFSSDLADVA
jgi:hypothetical protein